MKKLQFAVCGTGRRGASLARDTIIRLEDVELCALSDPYLDKAEECADVILERTGYRPRVYKSHEELFANEKPDAVFVATGWA